MRTSSTYKILLLLGYLIQKPSSKNEITEQFREDGFKINKATINSYIEKISQNGFKIKIKKNKRENVYFLDYKNAKLRFSEDELSALDEVKKLLYLQKDYNKIRLFMCLFYKLAIKAKDRYTQERLLDFEYYSRLNWKIVQKLNTHCKNKDIILLDYYLPNNENREITFHADFMRIASHTDRLYLHGIVDNTKHLSHLPVDRIYNIKKIIKKQIPLNLTLETFSFIISKEAYEKTNPEEDETLIELTDDYAHIKKLKNDKFAIMQRLLYFCPDLYYISDKKIKKQLKEKLEIMKDLYDNKLDL